MNGKITLKLGSVKSFAGFLRIRMVVLSLLPLQRKANSASIPPIYLLFYLHLSNFHLKKQTDFEPRRTMRALNSSTTNARLDSTFPYITLEHNGEIFLVSLT